MNVLDKDLMKWKIVGPSGCTFYYSSEEHMKTAVVDGGRKYMDMASYAISPTGKFMKNRSVGCELPNTILEMGRDKINALFDFMEGK